MLRTLLLACTITILLAAASVVSAQDANTEIRIAAHRHENGRVEFAIQERQDDGTWGKRMLPARRFFPAEGSGRWLTSSSLFFAKYVVPVQVSDLFVRDFEWSMGPSTYGRELNASALVQNNTGQTISSFDAGILCVDEDGSEVVRALAEGPALANGEVRQITFYQSTWRRGEVVECRLGFVAAVRLTWDEPAE